MKPTPSNHSVLPLRILVACALLCQSAFAQAQLVSADFDSLPVCSSNVYCTVPADCYRHLGGIFSRDLPVQEYGRIWPASQAKWIAAGGTPPHVMPISTIYDHRLTIDMTFVLPGTEIRATTDHVRAMFGDGNVGTSIGTLEAFDLKGNLIATATAKTPSTEWLPLEVRATNIARVRFAIVDDGGFIDNIVFNTPTNPAPPVLALRASEVELCWNSVSNRMYQTLYRSELTANVWTPLGAPVPGNGARACLTDTVPSGQPQRYYQMQSLGGGRIVVSHDDWVFMNEGFHDPCDPAIFAQNVASWFMGGRPGRFLAYSDHSGLTDSTISNVMVGAGHTWIVSTNEPFTLSNLLTFDAVFLCASPAADNAVLVEYVNAGGNVYLGAQGYIEQDMVRWNTFLRSFGLEFADARSTGIENVAIESAHPIFSGVDHLYANTGTSIVDLQPGNPTNQVLVARQGKGFFAVWDPDPSLGLGLHVSEVEVSWNSWSNATYRVEYKTEWMLSTWATLLDCVPSAGANTFIYDKTPQGQPQRFYQVVLTTNCVSGL